MLNLIIMGFILNLFLDIINKRKSYSTLSCGIFAWVGTSPDKFSPLMFNVLGIYNDNRGGDSSGVYFNRGVIHGIGTNAKYESLTKSEKLHTTVRPGKWPVVIGHCRKSSSGTISLENAQPVLVRNEKTEKLQYVHAHNGTITNHKELAEKYKVAFTAGESDSVVMARLIQKAGFDVLEEYEGSAALVMHFINEPNSLYAFHGQSKNYNYVTEERPLHCISIKGSGTYISSDYPPLEFIGNGEKASSFKYNVLYKLTGDNIIEVRTIERTNAIQKKSPYVAPTTNSNNNIYGYQGNGKTEWDPHTHRWVPIIQSQIPFEIKKTSYSTKGVTSNIITSDVTVDIITTTDVKKVFYNKGYFYCDGALAHGRKIVDSWGWIKSAEEKTSLEKYILYFFYGMLLTGEEAWDDMRFNAEQQEIANATDFYQQQKFSTMAEKLYYNSVFPFTRRHHQPGSGYMEESHFFCNEKGTPSSSYYTGSFRPLFSTVEYEFDNGDFIAFIKQERILTIAMFMKENEYFRDTTFAETLIKEAERHTKEVDKMRKDILKGEIPPSDDNLVYIMDCIECAEHKLDKDGQRCFTCNMEFGKMTVADMKKADEEKVSLLELIAHNVPPILDDLDQVIGDLENTANTDSIKNEYTIIVDAREKLKELKL